MKTAKRLSLIVSLIFLATSLFCAGKEETASLRIIYSASLNGNLDGCRCKSNRRAGLVKRAYYLKSMYKDSKITANTILVDAGDILNVYPDPMLADAILKTYSELGYTAVAVGDQEFSNGIDKILEYREKYPLISNNLSICPDENRCIIFSLSPMIIEKAGVKIGIFALLDPYVFTLYPKELKKHITLSPPETAAENTVEQLNKSDAALKILLYHGPYENAVKLIKNVPGIDVVIVGHEQRLIDLTTIGKTVLVSPGREGNRIGILTVSLSKKSELSYINSFKLFDYEKDPDDKTVRVRIDQYIKAMHSKLKSAP